ncbi:TetR/AcrR family transcriptional regulator [Staphylococcus delphini]|uniref:TetR/AcrR family transcriptional regulator n=1 Tax=Staphylococcus delphini TaxID=53344 RepID=A0AAQ0D6Y2_9STAP|nr:TetR/AcrR family transcriptional regulator [Staphylococcus delphini]MDE9798667.1 TetR/AcrR family transcriptional regulator [Staphylococcus delphini]MDE9806653.1 TetR/AcrR family transcriptional regulator [Staphylococcus delphini]QUM67124.1 TetR/AcrR family transcriptional regulator [Staphylococcus delphini]QUM69567.1 TetR/AcrR family transcriptional regulator [Staphylococcus delphini]
MSKRSDALRNEQHILTTAQTLFNAATVEKVSMKKIAETAQIGTGTLYRHFSNKSDICSTLLAHEVTQMFARIDRYQQKVDDPHEQLRFIFLSLIKLMEDNVNLLKEIERTDKQKRVMMQTPFYVKLKEEVMACVTQLNIVKDPDFLSDMLINSFSADVFEYQHYVKGIPSEQFVDRILKIFIRGVQS